MGLSELAKPDTMKRRGFLLFPVILMVVGMLAMPSFLRAIPSRYVARLPEPLQQLGAPRDQAPILPTAAASTDASDLLQSLLTLEATDEPAVIAAEVKPSPTPRRSQTNEITQIPAPTGTATLIASPTPSATPTATTIPIPAEMRLEGFIHEFQTWNNCGPATLAMTLSYFDLHLTQEQTAAVLKPNPEDRNVSPYELVDFVKNETPLSAINQVNGNLDVVRRLVANGIPVILEIGIEPPGEFRWLGWYGHYLLVVAYDDAAAQFWVYDSWFGTSEEPLQNTHADGRVLTYADLEEFWPHFNRNYLAIYRPEESDIVKEIIGEEMDETIMWQNALTTVQAETASHPENAFFWFNLGTIYNAVGRYDQAAAAFDQSRSLGLPWRMLWYQFGPFEAYYQVGRYEDVILLADLTLKDRPYFEESYYYRGLAQAALGEIAEALASFARAIEFNPNYTLAAEALKKIEN
jgi:tetratricopeptide (TPR) repeat protein